MEIEGVLGWIVRAVALATWIGVPLYSMRIRGRRYGLFSGVALGLALPGALITHARLLETVPAEVRPLLDLGFLYSLVALGVHLTSLVHARMRSPAFRWLISIPAQMCIVAGFFAAVWLLVLSVPRLILWGLGWDAWLGALRWLDLVPFGVAVMSLVTSTRVVPEVVRVALGTEGPATVERVPLERYRRRSPAPLERRPLRIVQITDPHLGPWQPIQRLRRQIEELARNEPDLVLLTGDFLTMESRGTPGALAQSLEPLRRLRGRTFATFGNHDHEAPDEVREALEVSGIELLLDAEARVETPVGPVQIVGADYVGQGREQHIQEVLARFPRRPGELRLFLLHDPLGFQFVPKGDVDLTLSGHTHGGHVGLVSFGLDWTVMTRTAWPDHGLFGHGPNRLYVHRGTGFYGFPLRVGVPGEASLLELMV